MELETTTVERIIHLALFVSGGLVLGLGGLALVERSAGPGRRIVRWTWIGGAAASFVLLFGLERLYHAF